LRRLNGFYLAVLVVLGLAPFVAEDWQLLQLAQYLCYGLLAASLSLIWGQAGLLCFGQSLFFGLGAYTMSLAALDMLPGLRGVGSGWLSLLLAGLVPAIAAFLLGRFLFHGRGLRGAYFGIVMLAICIVAERLATSWDYVGGLNGLMNVPPFSPVPGSELVDARPTFWGMLVLSAAVLAGLEALIRSRWGSALRAIRDGEDRLALLGYDVAGYKTTAFAISAVVAGLGGACFVVQFGFVSPPLIGFGLATEALIWAALGGRGVLLTAFLGALLVRWLEGTLSESLGAWWLLALGGLFVLVVVLLPGGLLAEPLLRWSERSPRRSTE
jgi:urea ABC transporter permease protein UrtC